MKRRTLIKSLGLLGLSGISMKNLNAISKTFAEWPDSDRIMPVIFIGHGAPLYALGSNKYANAWSNIGQSIPKPKAIICISAHWLTPGKTLITAAEMPKTIYDFGRINDRLFQISYPAPGNPDLAEQIAQNLSEIPVSLDYDWGFDHGTWCVLHHMFPQANIPVLQLSINYSQGAAYHFQLAQQLAFLRKKDVLIICSGNIVHNLKELSLPEHSGYDWAIEFDNLAKRLIINGDFNSLLNYEKLGKAALLSIPTPDHYFPLLYALGLKTEKDNISFPIEGMSYGSTSMRSLIIQ